MPTAPVTALAEPPFQELIWKDEMNLCELPLSTISERAPEGLTSLDFCVTEGDGETVRRVSVIPPGDDQLQRLVEVAYPGLVPEPSARPARRRKGDTNSAAALPPKAAKLLASVRGLPNATDDDVLLALLQLTRKAGFASRRVDFSLYEVVKLLGWDDGAKSYTRVIVSLLRWKAVLLTYHDSWRDNSERRWVTRTFNMLDEVTIFSAPGRRPRAAAGQAQLPFSSFAWSEAMFKSFQDGFLKNLDFGVYKGLDSRIAKRMYRFLDKVFGRLKGPSVSFDLRDFACGHVGLVGEYEPWKLKQVLAPGLRELEAKGIIQPLPADRRYEAEGRGKWRIVFHPVRSPRPLPGTTPSAPAPAAGLVATLEGLGVTRTTAESLVAGHPAERIELQLDVLGWWRATGRKPAIKEPGAWLAKAVRDGYAPPREYEPKAERERRQQATDAQARQAAERRRLQEQAAELAEAERVAALQARADHVDAYLAGLSPAARAEFERQALAGASDTYRENIRRGTGPLAEVSRRLVIEEAVLKVCPLR